MKLWAVFACLGLMAVSMPDQPLKVLEYQRAVTLAPGAAQQFIVVTADLWPHVRADLGDVRLYSDGEEVPHVAQTGALNVVRERIDCKILQPAKIAGNTQFILDMTGMEIYSRVQLQITKEDFVARARIEGANDVHAAQWALLGSSTLYDFTTEKLGHSGTLQMPVSTYRYLRVTLEGPVKPSEVDSAQAEVAEGQSATWLTVAQNPKIERRGHDTVLTFTVLPNVPVERVHFDVANPRENFLRTVDVQTGDVREDDRKTLGTGTLRRIHLQRGGKQIDEEDNSIAVDAALGRIGQAVEPTSARETGKNPRRAGGETLRVVIHNGDDRPLAIDSAQLQQRERRIYFQTPAVASAVTLYYGNERLSAPSYDYARLFQLDKAAGQATLLAEALNAQYQEPPDPRPWTERHPAAMWACMVAAILVLGVLAKRSLRSAAA